MEENEVYQKLLENLFDGVYFVDLDQKINFWNKAAERITGFKKSEVTGKCCSDNILRHIDDNGNDLCVNGCPLRATIKDGKTRDSNAYLHHKDGHRVPISIRVTPVYDNNNEIIGAVEIFSDNSNLKEILKDMENLKKDAYIDPLTEIGNRRYSEIVLKAKLEEAKNMNFQVGVFYLDLDHFKKVNDTYGHNAGDKVLMMAAKSLLNAMRRMDIVCRLGGEEFLVIAPNIDIKTLPIIAERIRMFIERSFIILDDQSQLNVTASIGATLSLPGDTNQSIIQRADKLMYHSKQSGRNKVTLG